jgi:hypothetical protein
MVVSLTTPPPYIYFSLSLILAIPPAWRGGEEWSSPKSKSRYDRRSVSQYVLCRAHCGTCDQVLIVSEFCCIVSVWRPLWREVRSVSCQSLSEVIFRQFFFCPFFPFYTSHLRSTDTKCCVRVLPRKAIASFPNPILFAICKSVFRKLFKNIYSGMYKSAQYRSSVANGFKVTCGFWEWNLQLNITDHNLKYDIYTMNLVDGSFGRGLCYRVFCLVAPWSSVLGQLVVRWGEHCIESCSG